MANINKKAALDIGDLVGIIIDNGDAGMGTIVGMIHRGQEEYYQVQTLKGDIFICLYYELTYIS